MYFVLYRREIIPSQLFGYKHDLSHISTGFGVTATFMGTHSSQQCLWQLRMLPICCCLPLLPLPPAVGPISLCATAASVVLGTPCTAQSKREHAQPPGSSWMCLRHSCTPPSIYGSATSRLKHGNSKRCLFNHFMSIYLNLPDHAFT